MTTISLYRRWRPDWSRVWAEPITVLIAVIGSHAGCVLAPVIAASAGTFVTCRFLDIALVFSSPVVATVLLIFMARVRNLPLVPVRIAGAAILAIGMAVAINIWVGHAHNISSEAEARLWLAAQTPEIRAEIERMANTMPIRMTPEQYVMGLCVTAP